MIEKPSLIRVFLLSLLLVVTTATYTAYAVDPPANGRLLDLYTQEAGIGPGTPGGTFELSETVELSSNLTYNGYPVQQKLVSFVVSDASNQIILIETATTNASGTAVVSFRIRFSSESIGTWTVVSTADIACIVVADSLTFEVRYTRPPHGPIAVFVESTETPLTHEAVKFDASESVPGWDGINVLPITEYRWDFGDGNTTTTSEPIVYHAYKEGGIYYVTLTVYAPGATPETDTAPVQRKVVVAPPVGGSSVLLASPTADTSIMLYFALFAVNALTFTLVRRKTPKKTNS